MRLGFWLSVGITLIAPLWIAGAEKGDPARGKEVYKRCSVCHGETGDGNPAIAKAYGVSMKPLGAKAVQSMTDDAIRKVILEGKGKMQRLTLTDEEVEDVIAYLRTLKK